VKHQVIWTMSNAMHVCARMHAIVSYSETVLALLACCRIQGRALLEVLEHRLSFDAVRSPQDFP
jgi:hypothetical protein